MTVKIKALIFDLGQVLVKLDLPHFYEVLISKSQKKITEEQFIEEYVVISESYHQGKILDEQFYRLIRDHFQLNALSQSQFFHIFNNIVVPDIIPEMVELLMEIKQKKKYKILCLSNTNSSHMNFGNKHWSFLKCFDELILSHEVHVLKPDPKIYQIAIQKARCKPEEIVFIDDNLKNIQGAKKLGIIGIKFTNRDKLVEELKKLEII